MAIPNSCCKRILNTDPDAVLTEHIGEKFREYREAWYRADQDHIPFFPVHLDLELMDSCNQYCTFCPRNRETHPDLPYRLNTGAVLEEKRLDSIYREAEKNSLYSINIAFGEPLIYKDVFRVVRKFHEIGVVDSRIVTNGLLLDRYIDEVFDSGLVNLYISISAFSEETYRKQKGKGYERVVDNTLLVLREKSRRNSLLPIVRVSFVETETNRHELEGFKNFWGEKVDLLDIQFYQNFSNVDAGSGIRKWRCIDPFRRLAVTANGDILPCCTFYGKLLAAGNIGRDTLKEAWRSKKMAQVRRDLLNGNSRICRACQEC